MCFSSRHGSYTVDHRLRARDQRSGMGVHWQQWNDKLDRATARSGETSKSSTLSQGRSRGEATQFCHHPLKGYLCQMYTQFDSRFC